MSVNPGENPASDTTWTVREIPVGPLSDFLSLGENPHCVWGPDGGVVGWGEACRFTAPTWSEVVAQWRSYAEQMRLPEQVRALAKAPFDAVRSQAPAVVIVPRSLVVVAGNRAWQVSSDDRWQLPKPRVVDRSQMSVELGLGDAYRQSVAGAVAEIQAGRLSKVVLSEALSVAGSIPAADLALRLAVRFASCWIYCVDGLVGASPEPLARQSGRVVRSRVLAGTVPQGQTDTADLLTAAMQPGGKNRREHTASVQSAIIALGGLSVDVEVSDVPYALELPNVVHLASDLVAQMRRGVDICDVVAALHPTAAVCGTPTDTAAALIRLLEDRDRRYYAGPVGWCNPAGDGEFVIALRGAELLNNQIILSAGAGIVDGSSPDDEWAEVCHKLQPMIQALS